MDIISDIGGSGKSEIDPFGIPGLLSVVEREHSHGMLTYNNWPMTSFMDFVLHVIRTLFQQDSYIVNQIAASVVSHSPHQV